MDLVVDNAYWQRFQRGADAGAMQALAGFDREQGAVHGTLDQRTVHIQELVRRPVQRRPGVRAAIAVGKDLVITTYDEQPLTISARINVEAAASRLIDLVQRAEEGRRLIVAFRIDMIKAVF